MNTTEFRNPHTAEVAHDTKLLELLYDELRANNTAAGMARRLVEFAGEHRDDKVHTVYGRTRVVKVRATGAKLTLGAAVELVEEFADEAKLAEIAAHYATLPGRTHWFADPAKVAARAAKHLADLREAVDAAEAAAEAVADHEAGYTGWARYFLVTTSAGHVHKDRACHTCRPTTGYAPVPMLAAATPAEAVALLGPNMCTVCFPEAPVADVGGKLTKKLAMVLMEEGEEAFRAEAAKLHGEAKGECPGSRTANFDRATARMGYYTGNYGTCNVCGERVTLTKTNNLRGHKTKGA